MDLSCRELERILDNGLKTSGFAKKKGTAPKLGDLLVAADITSEADLQNAVQMANQTKQPLSRVLVELKYCSQKVIDDVAKIQVLVMEGNLNGETAIRALGRSYRQNIEIEAALGELGWAMPVAQVESELGLMLLSSNLISRAIYDEALRKGAEENSTFGEYLIMHNILSLKVINAALQATVLSAQGRLTRKDASAVLNQVCSKNATFWEALLEVGFDSRTVSNEQLSLGEVLTQGGLISETERIASVEQALAEKRMLGNLLVESGLISKRALESALEVQELARSGVVSGVEAADLLKTTERTTSSLKETIEKRFASEDVSTADSAIDLLRTGGFLRESDLSIAAQKSKQFGVDILRGLVVAGLVDRTVFEAVRELVPEVASGARSRDEAIMLLGYVDRSRCSLAEAIGGPAEHAQATEAAAVALSQTGQNARIIAKPTPKDYASLDEAVRKELAPTFVKRFLASLVTLTIVFACLVLILKTVSPMDLGLIFSLLLIVETIRIILTLDKRRREMFSLRTLDIEGVQNRPGTPKRRKDDT